jgi:hypothetical protein
VATRPGAREAGVSCALRKQVPVVEDGPDLLDPYQPWLTSRVSDDVVTTCEAAAVEGFAVLHGDILRRIHPLSEAAGLDSAAFSCRFEPDGPRLRIVVCGPSVGRSIEQALAVRVLDAVRASGRTFGQVDVGFEEHAAV